MARIDKTVRAPVVWWAPEQVVDVPRLTTGTLVIRDVDRLDARQQERLGQWIGAHGPRVQVLALARASLFARVEDGRFSAALYSRLNTVMVEVRGLADLP
jgi:DNA-binding NtrC family response regulator